MRRGEVWWVNCDPSVGSEMRKRRPGVILSNDGANARATRVQIALMSSSIKTVRPYETLVTVGGKTSKVMADQLTTMSKLRVGGKLGRVSAEELTAVEDIVRIQLGL